MKPPIRLTLALSLTGLLVVACADPSGAGGTTVGSAASTTTSAGAGASAGMAATTTAGGSSSDGGAGGAGPSAGGGGADLCPDQGPGEGNDTMETATQLAGGTDCDDLGTPGTIDGPDDVDWYMYAQTGDEFGCNVNPVRDWSVEQGHTLRVCKYVECQVTGMSPDTVNCNDGSSEDAQGGLEGCCDTEPPFDVGIGAFGCPGGDDLLNVYTRVDEPGAAADTCTDYNLNYTF